MLLPLVMGLTITLSPTAVAAPRHTPELGSYRDSKFAPRQVAEAPAAATCTANSTKAYEQYRPAFHFQPKSNWINDPCGKQRVCAERRLRKELTVPIYSAVLRSEYFLVPSVLPVEPCIERLGK